MLQRATPGTSSLAAPALFRPLQALLNTVRLQTVYFNAQDVYTLCVTIQAADTLKLMRDADFIRGLNGAFQRADQSVLSPFQVNVVNDTFSRAGLRVTPKDIAVPDEDEASPESLLNNLLAMIANKNRDDRKITQITRMMKPMLEDFAPPQLVQAVRSLSMLKCTDAAFMSLLGKRAADTHEDLSCLDVATIVHSLCLTPGITHGVLMKLLEIVNHRCEDFKPEDLALVLQGLIAVGPRYKTALDPLVLHALEQVETLNANVLGYFLGAFNVMEYRDKNHIEIIADAIVEKSHELGEKELVMTMMAILELKVLSPSLFDAFAEKSLGRALRFDPRNIAPLMDVCSRVGAGANTDVLMKALMDRSAEAAILFNSNQLGDTLEILATYPPAKQHSVVLALGKQCKRRMEGMGPPPLAKAVYGLATLGFADPDLYVDAALVQLRWGFKDYSVLEPILLGLVSCGFTDPQVVKMLSSHVFHMAKQMSLQQVERCNMYLNRLQCDDEKAYRGLADRVRVFVKEITPDVPQEIQALLERAAASQAEYEAKQEARRAARGQRHSYR
jgi:hypothetical protein